MAPVKISSLLNINRNNPVAPVQMATTNVAQATRKAFADSAAVCDFFEKVADKTEQMPLALPRPKSCEPIVDVKKTTQYESLLDMEVTLKKKDIYYPNSRMTMYHDGKEWILTCGESYLPENTITNKINHGKGVYSRIKRSKNFLKIEREKINTNEWQTYEEVTDNSGLKTTIRKYRTDRLRVGDPSPQTVYRSKNIIGGTSSSGPVHVNLIETTTPDGSRILKEEYVVPTTGLHIWVGEEMARYGVKPEHYFIRDVKFTRETELTKGLEEVKKQPFKVEFLEFYDIEAPSSVIKAAKDDESLAIGVFTKIFNQKNNWIKGMDTWERLKSLLYEIKPEDILV